MSFKIIFVFQKYVIIFNYNNYSIQQLIKESLNTYLYYEIVRYTLTRHPLESLILMEC